MFPLHLQIMHKFMKAMIKTSIIIEKQLCSSSMKGLLIILFSRRRWFYWVLLDQILAAEFSREGDYNTQSVWWLGCYYMWYIRILQLLFGKEFQSFPRFIGF